MYALYCPSCKHTTEQPFVRVGAIVRCVSCGHVYRIGTEHFEHHAAPQYELTNGEPDPLLPNGKPASVNKVGESSGLTGLAGLMDEERRAAARATKPNPRTQPVPEASVGSGSGLSQMQPAPEPVGPRPSVGPRPRRPRGRHRHRRQLKHRQTQRILMLLAIGLAATVIALLAMLYYAKPKIPANAQRQTPQATTTAIPLSNNQMSMTPARPRWQADQPSTDRPTA